MVEQVLIDCALKLSDGNRTAASRMLGVHRKVVARRAERSGGPPEPDDDTITS
jgi:DNA-binding protein Fis